MICQESKDNLSDYLGLGNTSGDLTVPDDVATLIGNEGDRESFGDVFVVGIPRRNGDEGVGDGVVVVIDDVMTSGGTLQAMAGVLWKAKPKSLHAVVLAIADPRGRQFQSI